MFRRRDGRTWGRDCGRQYFAGVEKDGVRSMTSDVGPRDVARCHVQSKVKRDPCVCDSVIMEGGRTISVVMVAYDWGVLVSLERRRRRRWRDWEDPNLG